MIHWGDDLEYINDLDNVFYQITNYYCQVNNIIELPNYKLVLTDNIYTESLKLMSESEIKEDMKYENSIEQLNGRMLYRTQDRPFYILINKKQLNEQFDFVGTYYHELTHVIDFDRYMNEVKANNIIELSEDRYYWTFYLWTEFHARYIAYSQFYDYINYANGYKEDISEKINYIESKEKEFQANYYYKQIEKYNNNITKIPLNIAFQELFYEVSQFYGRFSKWHEYGIEFKYDGNVLLNEFKHIRKELIDYYNILLKCKKYEGFKQHKYKIFNIINDLYRKI